MKTEDKTMRQIKVGVIGLGWFGEKHCEVLAGLPEAELAAVCTRTPARLAEVRAAFNVPKAFTDYREMLADPVIDVVSVVTMWDQHVEPTVAALDAGKHVFLEKPMASTVADCDRIIDAARRSRGSLMVGHERSRTARCQPAKPRPAQAIGQRHHEDTSQNRGPAQR